MMAMIWLWRYGVMDVDEVEDDEWRRMFLSYSDSDDCSVDGVEVDGAYLTREEVSDDPEVKRLERKANDDARAWAVQAQQYKTILLRHPTKTDRWGSLESVKAEDVSARLSELAERYGARVMIR